MLYIQPPQGPWSSQHDLPHYWSMAAPTPTQASSAERSTLSTPYSTGGAVHSVPTPQGDTDMDMDMDMDNSRASTAPYQQLQQQQQQLQHQHQQISQSSPESRQGSKPRQLSGSLPSDGVPVRASFQTTTSQPPPAPPRGFVGIDASKVAAALEVARDGPDGLRDADVSGILESALSQIWDRVMAQPDSYVMTKEEFPVFNLYQHRFWGNQLAVAARRRFWDNAS